MNKIKNQTLHLTTCAVMAAVQVVILYFAGLFQTFDLAFTALTVFFMLFTVIELGAKEAWSVYAAVSIISLLLVPSKFVPMSYVIFFGCYPICKTYLERPKKLLSWMLKVIGFNGVFVAGYAISGQFLLIDQISPIGSGLFFVALIIANAAFVLFDVLMTMAVTIYIFKFRKKFGLDRFFKHDERK